MVQSSATDSMRTRVEQSRYKFWILTEMNRWSLTGVVLVLVFAILVGFSTIGPAPMRRVIETANGLWWVFSPMITAIITAVALVVTFSQLVLSQELGALGDQRERMKEASQFRADIDPWLDPNAPPPEPTAFLGALLDAVKERSEKLQSCEDEGIVDFATELTENAEGVQDHLENAQFGTFDVIGAALDFNYSMKIYEGRRLLGEHGDTLDDEIVEALEELVTLLEFYGATREHFKTLYFQWELVDLSRAMLYMSIPALLVALGMLLYVDPAGVSGTTLGVDNIVWLVCGAAAVTLAPFFILFSFVLRITTIAKRTLAIGAFILRETDASE